MMHKAWRRVEEVPYCFLRSSIKFEDHTGQKIDDLNPTWVILLGRSQLSNPSNWPCFWPVTKQLYEWFCPSVHPSVCLSQLFRCLCHRIIMKFSEVIIIDKSDVHAKSQGQRSKGKGQRAQKKFYPNLGFFGPKLQFWILRWQWNYAQSLKWHRRHALFKVILEIPRSHRTKTSSIFTRIERFWTVTPVWIHQWFWNDAQSLKYHRWGALLFFRVRWFVKFEGRPGQNFSVIRQILSL